MWEFKEGTSDFSYRLCLSVNLIWPLLVGQYTESEKIGYRVKIAMVMLHELAVCAPFTSVSSHAADLQPELACLQL